MYSVQERHRYDARARDRIEPLEYEDQCFAIIFKVNRCSAGRCNCPLTAPCVSSALHAPACNTVRFWICKILADDYDFERYGAS